MRITKRLFTEAGVVGAALALVLALVAALWPGALQGWGAAGTTGLLVGAAFHLGFEAAGLNAAYCVTGNACRL